MNWTTEAPTKPGFYWTTEDNFGAENGRIVVVEVTEAWKGALVFYVIGIEIEYDVKDATHWYGPLDVPKSPNDLVLEKYAHQLDIRPGSRPPFAPLTEMPTEDEESN